MAKFFLGPPPTAGLKPLAVATKTDRKGRWIWKEVPQKKRDHKLRKRWEKAMREADREGIGQFDWPPEED